MNPYEHLIQEGWYESPNALKPYSRNFYKRHKTPTRCACNNDKAGIQVSIAVYEHEGKYTFEINLAGELTDETWVELKNYSHTGTLEETIKQIPRLLKTWEAINEQ